MNKLLKTLIMVWLAFCAIFIWLACAIAGFALLLDPSLSFMYSITPLIGLTSSICIILMMVRVYRSNPASYIANLIRGYIGKAKI